MKYIIFQQLVNTKDTEQIRSCAHCVNTMQNIPTQDWLSNVFRGVGEGEHREEGERAIPFLLYFSRVCGRLDVNHLKTVLFGLGYCHL